MEGAGGIFCENRAMDWLVSLTGMPDGAFGVFTSGGTAANLSAMVTARETWRSQGGNRDQKGIIITSIGAHSSIKAMARVMDAEVRLVDSGDLMSGAALKAKIDGFSTAERNCLFAIVATGGTTNAGIVDDLQGISEVCQQENLWFHVDAAYGGGALVADSVRKLFRGIEHADSVTIDPHKWLFSPYDCGAIIYREPELARKVHAQEGSYLDIFKDEGAHGFNPADYQIQLTRRLRGLPLWFSLATHGTKKYRWAVERGIELAQLAGSLIGEDPSLELVREPSLSCVLFRRKGWRPDQYTEWTYRNHRDGIALVTPTKWRSGGTTETVLRFCFINPDTTEEDIRLILNTLGN
jgi:glutamate/tyrosine decarboxylase-like PLP-dependent enzyme